ncbi:MAG: O-antigen ligase family protein [Polyangiaceae bacterium]|nr:O-antigen ligase family protein [Polyangiaceae bacterium]
MGGARAGWILGAGAAAAALLYDPAASAADAKRAALLVAAIAALSAALGAEGAPRGARPGAPNVEPGFGAEGAPREARPGAPNVEPALGAPVSLWCGFVAWSAVSLAWGVPAGTGKLGVWVAAAGLALAAREVDARRAAQVAGAGIGGGSALFAMAQLAGGSRGFAIHGGHGNPNWLGLALAIALPLSIDLAATLRREGARAWPVAATLAALEVPALYLSHSRVAWAAAALTLLPWGVAGLARARGGSWARAGAILAVVVGAGTAAVAGAHADTDAAAATAADAGADRAAATGARDVPVAAAWEGRTWIWRASADAARRALPLGEGLGGFAGAYLDAQRARLAPLSPAAASRRFTNATTAHCDWLEAAIEGGLPGLALLAAAIVAGIAAAWRARWSAGAAAIAAAAIAALGDSPFDQPACCALVALALAASAPASAPASSAASAPRPRRRARARRLAAHLAALVAAALLLAAGARTWLAARRITRARDAAPPLRLTLLERAARLDPSSGEAALALGLARLELGDAEGALRDLERSRPLLANVGTDVAIGNAHLARGAPDRAAAAYARALAWNPGSFRAHANLTEALTQLGRLDEAAAHLAAARALWPGHPKLALIAERLRRARVDAGAAGE